MSTENRVRLAIALVDDLGRSTIHGPLPQPTVHALWEAAATMASALRTPQGKCSDCKHYWTRRSVCVRAAQGNEPGRPWSEPETCAPPWCPGFEQREEATESEAAAERFKPGDRVFITAWDSPGHATVLEDQGDGYRVQHDKYEHPLSFGDSVVQAEAVSVARYRPSRVSATRRRQRREVTPEPAKDIGIDTPAHYHNHHYCGERRTDEGKQVYRISGHSLWALASTMDDDDNHDTALLARGVLAFFGNREPREFGPSEPDLDENGLLRSQRDSSDWKEPVVLAPERTELDPAKLAAVTESIRSGWVKVPTSGKEMEAFGDALLRGEAPTNAVEHPWTELERALDKLSDDAIAFLKPPCGHWKMAHGHGWGWLRCADPTIRNISDAVKETVGGPHIEMSEDELKEASQQLANMVNAVQLHHKVVTLLEEARDLICVRGSERDAWLRVGQALDLLHVPETEDDHGDVPYLAAAFDVVVKWACARTNFELPSELDEAIETLRDALPCDAFEFMEAPFTEDPLPATAPEDFEKDKTKT